MTELRWTKKPPTEPGYYWWRRRLGSSCHVVRLMRGGRVYCHGAYGSHPVATYGGEWYGPLQEPGGDAVENCQAEAGQ